MQILHYEIDREKVAGTLENDFNYGLDIVLNKVECLAEKYGTKLTYKFFKLF